MHPSFGKECRHFFTLRRKSPEASLLDTLFLDFYAQGGEIQWDKRVSYGKIVDLRITLANENCIGWKILAQRKDRINPIVNPILGTQEAPGRWPTVMISIIASFSIYAITS